MEHKQDMETPIAEEGLRDDAHTPPQMSSLNLSLFVAAQNHAK
jgi:hypothetical protein